MASFLFPLEADCVKLAKGIVTYDSLDHEMFPLRAYKIFELGDIIAVEKLLDIRGHNAYCPCRSCLISGARNISGGGTNYYAPLIPPVGSSLPRFDPMLLPMRTHEHFEETLEQIRNASTTKACNQIGKSTGLRIENVDIPQRHHVGSINLAKSFPWEWMHLFAENIIPTLVKHWTGKFKHLDTGKEDYKIADHIWEDVGRETAEALKTIPSAFVRALGNIAEDHSYFTAESWAFWFMHLAPALLRHRFPKDKYYNHMCDLVTIMKVCHGHVRTPIQKSGYTSASPATLAHPRTRTCIMSLFGMVSILTHGSTCHRSILFPTCMSHPAFLYILLSRFCLTNYCASDLDLLILY
ncbi:hypothetical protein BU15DRAFT_55998 [Melanogaster broomeanus]|nr:hypothetical protein BU15DRAFT_55998 [Melanogaster broomeanus]